MSESREIANGRERLGMVVVLPLLIVIAAAAATYRTTPPAPIEYRATTVIRPPTTVQDSAAAVNLFVADLGEAITTDATVDHVISQVPGLEKDTYLDRIDASRRGTTSSVALSFIHPDEAVAAATVGTLARRVLDDAARGEYERTQFLLERATERLDRAEAAMEEFFRGTSAFDPEFEYRGVLNEIAQLDQQITTGQALSYGETYQTELTARRTELQALLPELGAAMLIHRRLSAELDTAQAAWEEATINNDLEEFEYRTVNSVDELITSEEVEPFVDETPRLQATALAGAVALVLSLVVILPVAAWLSRPRGRHKLSTNGEPARTVDLNAMAEESLSDDGTLDVVVTPTGRTSDRSRRRRERKTPPPDTWPPPDAPTDERQLELFHGSDRVRR
jgi:hypothetical protein